MKNFYTIFLLLITLVLSGFAEEKTLDRKYVPIILKGAEFPINDFDYQNWNAYKFDKKSDSWSAVPFQVDELWLNTNSNRDVFEKKEKFDYLFNDRDEFVMMPSDFGDQASVSSWVNGYATDSTKRVELLVTDPNNGNQAWVYLFHKQDVIATVDTSVGYPIEYTPGPEVVIADTVKSLSYKLGSTEKGWIDYVSLSNNFDLDLVDRFKLRIYGKTSFVFGSNTYSLTEGDFMPKVNPGPFYPHKVRSIHKKRSTVKLPSAGERSADYEFLCFPYSIKIGDMVDFDLDNLVFASAAGLKKIRQSLDLSKNAIGMNFYSSVNPTGSPIDGVNDTFDRKLENVSGLNWVMASGEQGTILMFLELPVIKDSDRYIYYHDDANGGSFDSLKDTGDGASYGDMGLYVTKSPYMSEGSATIKFHTYFIPTKNQTAEFAELMLEWESTKVNMIAEEQEYQAPSSVKFGFSPEQFELHPAYPNPYKPGQGNIKFEFDAARVHPDSELIIYNALGQQVAHVLQKEFRKQTGFFKWNGKTDKGLSVPPGVYFYMLSGGKRIATQKFIVLK